MGSLGGCCTVRCLDLVRCAMEFWIFAAVNYGCTLLRSADCRLAQTDILICHSPTYFTYICLYLCIQFTVDTFFYWYTSLHWKSSFRSFYLVEKSDLHWSNDAHIHFDTRWRPDHHLHTLENTVHFVPLHCKRQIGALCYIWLHSFYNHGILNTAASLRCSFTRLIYFHSWFFGRGGVCTIYHTFVQLHSFCLSMEIGLEHVICYIHDHYIF